MKKMLQMAILVIALSLNNLIYAQDTIVAWTFPQNSADSLVDVSIPLNSSRYLSCQYGTFNSPTYYEIAIDYSLQGSGSVDDYCASVGGIDFGKDSVYWMVKFKTTGYENLKFSSKQKAMSSPLPLTKELFQYKIQYKLSGTSVWNDLVNPVLCDNDWTTGSVSDVQLPAACNNQSGQISIRWLQISNILEKGNSNNFLDKIGAISMLDDIVVTGTVITDIAENNEITPSFDIYPNPSNGSFTIESNKQLGNVKIFDIAGKNIFEKNINDNKVFVDGLKQGIYLISVLDNNNQTLTKKIIVK